MATVRQLLVGFQLQIRASTTGLRMVETPVEVHTALGWPPARTIQQVVKMRPPAALVSVFDRKLSRDTTRWIPNTVQQMVTFSSVASSPPTQVVLPLGSTSIVLAGQPATGDAVSLVVYDVGLQGSADPGDGSYTATPTAAAVASAAPGDDSSALARRLAAGAAANATLAATVAVATFGPVVVVTSLVPRTLVVSSYTGNGGVNTVEIGRRQRDVQLTVWSPSTEIRDMVGDRIEALVSQIEVFRGSTGEFFSGLPLGDGTSGRVKMANDFLVDDGVLSDVYRRDMIVSVDYSVTVQDQLYSVLAPILSYQVQSGSAPPRPPPVAPPTNPPGFGGDLDFSSPDNSEYIAII